MANMTFMKLALTLVGMASVGFGTQVQKAYAGLPENSFRKAEGRIFPTLRAGPACVQ